MTGEFIQRWDGMVLAAMLSMMLAAWLRGSIKFQRSSAQRERLLAASEASGRSAAITLAERNRLLELTEEIAEIGHWRLNLHDDSVFWSDGTFRIHNLSPGARPPLAKAIEAFHPDDRAMVAAHVETARRDGTSYSFRARLVMPDGAIKHVEAHGQPELDGSGTPVALFGMLADRTTETNLRRDALEQRDRANALGRAKGQFLVRMSHVLRTPSAAIATLADPAQYPASSPAHRTMTRIASQAQAVLNVLDDVLDLSQIEAGTIQLDVQAAALAELLEETTEQYRSRALGKRLPLALRIDDDVPSIVMTDRARLQQIVGNLIANAVQHTDSGFITITARRRGEAIVICVRDTGIGIPEAQQANVFTSFVQIQSERAEIVDGMTAKAGGEAIDGAADTVGVGLGLPVSRQLAELMGGTLELESTGGVGSAFVLTIPCRASETVPQPDAEWQDSAPMDSPALDTAIGSEASCAGRILLAEDHDINQMLIVQMAASLGLDVDVAADGQVAMQKVRQAAARGAPYALVLMDLQMPNMTGLEATIALRAQGHDASSLPIVALSANAFPDDVRACEDAGMQGHLAKPVTLARLKEKIAPFVDIPAAASSHAA